ncbi:MAG: endolytic transglycosylase MltG [Lachnospiraceae bacterium]|nr:endolytic transglycosylase MltG [Lachnospiraceae bacterium]
MKQFIVSIATAAVKIIALVLIVRYVAGLASEAYAFGYRIFSEEPVSGEPGITYMVELSEETTPKQVAQALEDYGLVRDKDLFYVQYLMSPHKDELMPGNYELSTAMTAEEMLEIMSSSYVEKEEGED